MGDYFTETVYDADPYARGDEPDCSGDAGDVVEIHQGCNAIDSWTSVLVEWSGPCGGTEGSGSGPGSDGFGSGSGSASENVRIFTRPRDNPRTD